MSSPPLERDGSSMSNPGPQVDAERGPVEDTAQARPRLVFFHSKTDGRSRRVEGFPAQVLQRRRNHDAFVVHHVEVGEHQDLAARFRIDKVPTLVVVADRRVEARLTHPRGCRQIEEMLKPWLR
jgi:thioredoxin-like negative regulator of GroEL